MTKSKTSKHDAIKAVAEWTGVNIYTIVADENENIVCIYNEDCNRNFRYYKYDLRDDVFHGWTIVSRREYFDKERAERSLESFLEPDCVYVSELTVEASSFEILKLLHDNHHKIGKLKIKMKSGINQNDIKRFIIDRTKNIVAEVRNES
jgi:hypothetical protein